MENLICVTLSIAYLLMAFYNSNGFAEYLWLVIKRIHFDIMYVGEFKITDYMGLYTDFLIEKHNDKFWVKLITCPICLAFWLSLVASFLVGIKYVFVIAFLSLILYYLLEMVSPKH